MKKQFYVSQNQVYKECIEVVDYGVYKDYILLKSKREKGFEEEKNKEKEKKKEKTEKEEVERIEQSRAKRIIKELALCNDFEYFYTQTLKENRFDFDNFIKEIQKRFKAYKRKNKDFIYLIIYEKHKDGAYHLHGLVAGLGLDLYTNKNGYLSLSDFEDLGFNSLKKLGLTDEDKSKVASYITKYITKDFIKSSKNQSYFRSYGLKTAKRTVIDDIDYNKLDLKYENDFVKIFKEKKLDDRKE